MINKNIIRVFKVDGKCIGLLKMMRQTKKKINIYKIFVNLKKSNIKLNVIINNNKYHVHNFFSSCNRKLIIFTFVF